MATKSTKKAATAARKPSKPTCPKGHAMAEQDGLLVCGQCSPRYMERPRA